MCNSRNAFLLTNYAYFVISMYLLPAQKPQNSRHLSLAHVTCDEHTGRQNSD